MKFWKLLALCTLGALSIGQARAHPPEQKDVRLGVGGTSALYYLPLALTERLGYFKERGLTVEINAFKGGSPSLRALIGGSADLVTGGYEHTLRMQAKGQDVLAVIELGRDPGLSLAAKKDRADKIKSVADLKGSKSIANIDPVMAKLGSRGDIATLAETATTEARAKVFGGPMSAAVISVKRDWLEKNPHTVALTHAFYRTLKWAQRATPEEIAGTVPQDSWLGDKALYTAAVKANRQLSSQDGIVSAESRQRSRDFLKQFDKEIAAASIDSAKTWDDRCVKKATATMR